MKPKSYTRPIIVRTALVAILTTPFLHAVSSTWTGGGASGIWGGVGNWTSSVVATGANDTATFANTYGTYANPFNIVVNTNRTIGNINFTGTSNDLTISRINTNTLTLDVTTGSPTLTVANAARTLTLTTPVAGNDGMTKAGLGTLILNPVAANTFTGGTIINAGVLQIGSTNALNSTAGSQNAVTFGASSTGTLRLAGNSITIGNLATNATPGTTFVENASGTSSTLTIGNGSNASGTYAGTIQNGTGTGTLALRKAGTGTLTLSGTNTYSGGTTIGNNTANVGIVNITNGSALGTGAVSIVSNAGGSFFAELTLNSTTGITIANNFTTSGEGSSSSGIIRNTTGNNQITGNITLGSGGGNTRIHSNGGSLTLSGDLAPNTTSRVLILGGTATGTVSGNINNGAGANTLSGVTKEGASTWTLSGSNGYTGATLVSGGTLVLSGSGASNSSSGITINGSDAKFLHNSSAVVTPTVTLTQGTLTGNGTVNTVNVGAGGIISNNDGVAGASLTIGTLTFSGAATVNTFGNTTAPIVTSSLITSGGAVTINPTAESWDMGTYDLISYNGTYASGGVGDFILGTVANSSPRQSKTLGNSGTAITLTFGADDQLVWSGVNGGNWTTTPTNDPVNSPNWALTTGQTNANFWAGDRVRFNDTYDIGGGSVAVAQTAIDISAANVSPISTLFNNSEVNYTLSSTGGFGIASGSLTKSGSGRLTITNANTYTGATSINGGTLTLGDGGALSSSSAISVGSGAIFAVNQSDTVTQGSDFSSLAISGAGGFTQAGSGTTIFNVANTYNGITAINGGTLQLSGTAGALTGTTGITSSGTATFALNRSNAFSQVTDLNGQAIAGTDLSLLHGGTGTTTLSLANSYGGLTTINSGVIRISDALALGGTANGLVVNGDMTGAATNARLELSGGIIVSGESATIKGNGNFLGALQGFSGANEWAGNVVIDGDLTRIGAASGASLLVSGVIDDGANDYRILYRMNDAASSVTLTGANTYTGGTSVVGTGALIVGSLNSVVGGTASSHLGAPTTEANGRIILGTGDTVGILRYAGIGETTDRTIQVGDGNGTGGGTIESSGASGALVFSAATLNAAHTGTSTRTLTLGGTNANANTVQGIIQNNSTGAVSVAKTGSGSWTLSGANTYTGSTIVDQGTLTFATNDQVFSGGLIFGLAAGSVNTGTLDLTAVNASFSSLTVRTNTASTNNITVGAGKTLTINGNVTVGANVADAVASLAASGGGNLVVGAGTTNTFQIGGVTGSVLSGSTAVDLSGLATFTVNQGSGGTFRLGDSTTGSNAPAGSTLKLASANTIATGNFRIGDGSGGNATHVLTLGNGANVINATTVNIGSAGSGIRSSGSMVFADADTTGTLTLRGFDGGTTRTTLNMVSTTGNTAVGMNSTVNLSGHTADLLVDTLTMARRTANAGGSSATLTFDQGTLDVTTLNMANRSNAVGNVTATVNLGDSVAAGVPTVTIGSITMAVSSGSGAGVSAANLNISGGNVGIGTGSGTAINMANAASGVAASSTLNITGGTVTLSGNITRTGGAGTETATLALNGASSVLDMAGYGIGASGAAITLNAESGILKNVASINGIGGLTKASAGTLTLDGVNGYVGDTVVSDGSFVLADNASMKFVLGAISGDSNDLSGGGTVSLNGDFVIDTTAANSLSTGTWLLENVTSLTSAYGSTFTVVGFTDIGNDKWEKDIGGGKKYTFDESTGSLTLSTTGTPYTAWAAAKGLDGTPGKENGTADDPDKDGRNNLAEFAFDGNPLSVADNGKVYGLNEDSDADANTDKEMILTVAVRNGTPAFSGSPSALAVHPTDGISYTIQGSLNLIDFTTAIVNVVPTPVITGLPPASAGYEYRSFSLDGSNGLTQKGFLRAKVSE